MKPKHQRLQKFTQGRSRRVPPAPPIVDETQQAWFAESASQQQTQRLGASNVVNLQRVVGNRAVQTMLAPTAIDRAVSNTVQRMLKQEEIAQLREIVAKKLGENWLEEHKPFVKTFNEVVGKDITLEVAIKQINGQLMFYRPVKKKEYKEDLTTWVVKNNIFTEAKDVEMSGFDKADKGASRHILWTISLGGCIGVAIYNGACGFLMHISPDQLKEGGPLIATTKTITSSIEGGSVVLSSPSLKAPYVDVLRNMLHKNGYKIVAEHTSDRLALDTNSGSTMLNFKAPW